MEKIIAEIKAQVAAILADIDKVRQGVPQREREVIHDLYLSYFFTAAQTKWRFFVI